LANIEEKVEKLIKEKVEKIGYNLYDVIYVKEGKEYFLRIFIDKPEGIDLNDCEKVNNEITDLLDEANYIKEQYFLEVSSPGVERILRKDNHLKDNIGNEVEINLFKPVEKQKQFIGILIDFDDNYIVIEMAGKKQELERKNISLIKTIYHWD